MDEHIFENEQHLPKIDLFEYRRAGLIVPCKSEGGFSKRQLAVMRAMIMAWRGCLSPYGGTQNVLNATSPGRSGVVGVIVR